MDGDVDGDVDVAVVVGWVDTSENPWATQEGPRHGPAGSTASQHRGHTGVGQGRTRDDGLRGAMCCVSLGWDGAFCWGHRTWHVGDGGFRWPERPGAAACLFDLVSRDGRFTWLYSKSVPAAGSQRVSDDLELGAGPMAAGGVVAPIGLRP